MTASDGLRHQLERRDNTKVTFPQPGHEPENQLDQYSQTPLCPTAHGQLRVGTDRQVNQRRRLHALIVQQHPGSDASVTSCRVWPEYRHLYCKPNNRQSCDGETFETASWMLDGAQRNLNHRPKHHTTFTTPNKELHRAKTLQ